VHIVREHLFDGNFWTFGPTHSFRRQHFLIMPAKQQAATFCRSPAEQRTIGRPKRRKDQSFRTPNRLEKKTEKRCRPPSGAWRTRCPRIVGGKVATAKRGARMHRRFAAGDRRPTTDRPDRDSATNQPTPTPSASQRYTRDQNTQFCALRDRRWHTTYLVSAVSARISERNPSASASIELYSMCKRRQ